MTSPNTDLTDQARTLIRAMEADVAGVRTDPRWTATAKKQEIAKTYLRTRDQIAALRAADESARANRIETLRKQIFGRSTTSSQGADIIAVRDAEERVGALNPDDHAKAVTMLERAHLNNDESMTKALLARAYEHGWVDVLNRYSAAHPAATQAVDELWDLSVLASPAHVGTLLQRELQFAVSKPQEISGLSDDQAREMVNTAQARSADEAGDRLTQDIAAALRTL